MLLCISLRLSDDIGNSLRPARRTSVGSLWHTCRHGRLGAVVHALLETPPLPGVCRVGMYRNDTQDFNEILRYRHASKNDSKLDILLEYQISQDSESAIYTIFWQYIGIFRQYSRTGNKQFTWSIWKHKARFIITTKTTTKLQCIVPTHYFANFTLVQLLEWPSRDRKYQTKTWKKL